MKRLALILMALLSIAIVSSALAVSYNVPERIILPSSTNATSRLFQTADYNISTDYTSTGIPSTSYLYLRNSSSDVALIGTYGSSGYFESFLYRRDYEDALRSFVYYCAKYPNGGMEHSFVTTLGNEAVIYTMSTNGIFHQTSGVIDSSATQTAVAGRWRYVTPTTAGYVDSLPSYLSSFLISVNVSGTIDFTTGSAIYGTGSSSIISAQTSTASQTNYGSYTEGYYNPYIYSDYYNYVHPDFYSYSYYPYGSTTTSTSQTPSRYITGWNYDAKGKWYRNANGSYLANQWAFLDGKWYYFNSEGYAVTNQWIGDYYLTADGSMATSTWIGNYYVGADGKWTGSTSSTAPTTPSTTASHGVAADGTIIWYGTWTKTSNDRWIFTKSDGTSPKHEWLWIDGNRDGIAECYYFNMKGTTSSGAYIDGYYVNHDGQWVENNVIQRKQVVK